MVITVQVAKNDLTIRGDYFYLRYLEPALAQSREQLEKYPNEPITIELEVAPCQ